MNQLRFLYPLMLLTGLNLALGPTMPANAQSPMTSPSATATVPAPAESAVTNPNTSKPIAQKEESWLDNSWPWISAALHAIELLGLVTFMIFLRDVNRKSKERDQKASEKIVALENGLRELTNQQRNLDASISGLKKSTAQAREMDRNFSASGLASPRSEQAPVNLIVNSEYPFLDSYQKSTDAFKHQYSPTTVSEDAENLQRRWAGEQQEIILGADRQGNYWLLRVAETTYLLPSPKLKVNDMNLRTAGGLFECANYHPGYRTMQVVKPAIVSAQSGMGNQRWKLEQKGVLEFT